MCHLYIHILQIYVGVRIIYCTAVYDTYVAVYVRICTYMPSWEQYNSEYIAVTAAVYACISSLYLHIAAMGWGDPCQDMSVYACIYDKNTCRYISQYMYVYPAVYPAVFLYVFPTVYCPYFCMYIQQYFLLYFSCICTRSRCRHGCFAFAGAGARSLHLCCAVATASLSRGSARHIAKFNQIWSARLNSGSQRQLVQARTQCALKCHGNLGWRSFTK